MSKQFKILLIAITVFAVISDSMLLPFYPTFFRTVFAINDPAYVGTYLAASCFVVMVCFPIWAFISKYIHVLPLLVYSQIAAGIFSLSSFFANDLSWFWFTSMAMFAFKASYLLVYPYLMSLEEKTKHVTTIATLSVVVHFGAILGALAGGVVLSALPAKAAFLIMALSDFTQVLVCAYLIKLAPSKQQPEPVVASAMSSTRWPIYQLGIVMLCFYFSAFLIRPFFAAYWQSMSDNANIVLASMVFSIPAFMALLALCFDQWRQKKNTRPINLLIVFILIITGVALQASPAYLVVIAGRCLFGLSLFIIIVRLDLLLYQVSTPDKYAQDFSKVSFCQSLGVLLASYFAGVLVKYYGLVMPFWIAAAGLTLSALCLWLLSKQTKRHVCSAYQGTTSRAQ
ncbi:MFS transporter [Pseudoalteromonas prydzensis]|uniref:MFS transporter n=1 Tax=Pseudoalteromonas prydzensis TaxID=182141 RepID=UPI0007E52812|nr:MFS transporter [Pseudoalteromonas prydzensis]MBE0377134.1 hypothetical protein [Pseudoalteromonas prydzensis ACAM 620]